MSNEGHFERFTEEYLKVAKVIVNQGKGCKTIRCITCPLSKRNSAVHSYCTCDDTERLNRAALFIKLYNKRYNGMQIEDLKTGMILKNRKGDVAMVLKGVEPTYGTDRDIIVGETWMPLNGVQQYLDVSKPVDDQYDIMEVWQPQTNNEYLVGGKLKIRGKCIWKRSDHEVKEMTVSEVNAQLGYKVKIVEG